VIVVHIDPSDLADEEALRRHVERTAEGYPFAAMHPAAAGRTNVAAELDDELVLVQVLRDEVRDLWNRGQSGGAAASASRRAELEMTGSALGSIRAALEGIVRLAQAQSIEVVVSTASGPAGRGDPRRVEGTARQWPPEELLAICDELHLAVIDATGDIESAIQEPARARRKGKLGRDAQEVYAEVLAHELLDRFMASPGTGEVARERVSSRSVDRGSAAGH
jgi:hypothetical protein